MNFIWTAGAVLAGLAIAFRLFMRSHRRWLERQSPVGVWTASDGDKTMTIQFEDGPHEGAYKQIAISGASKEREFGHWACHLNSLYMLIMASDRRNHPRFGEDTAYEIRYVAPDRIAIDGPDRPKMVFERAPEGTSVDIEPEQTI